MRRLRRNWLELVSVAITVAVLFGCIGYFAGTQYRGDVYQITGSKINTGYELEASAVPTESLTATETDAEKSVSVDLPQTAEEATAEETGQPAETVQPGLVNINTADSETLQTLPGIGPQRAQDILDYREEHGLFTVKEDLLKISGIGEKTLDKLLDLITVE